MECDLANRQFGSMATGGSTHLERQQKRFALDLNDSLTEMDLIVREYKDHSAPIIRYSAPSDIAITILRAESEKLTEELARASKAADTLKLPEKGATLAWIRGYVPVSTWLWAAGALGAAFTAGAAVGKSPIVQATGAKLIARL